MFDINKNYLGRHILVECFECNKEVLTSVEIIEKIMIKSALECGATVVEKCFHKFNPFGVSGVVIISESHFAIHTWPELGYAAVDLFTCGENCNPMLAYNYLKNALDAKNTTYSELKRGILDKEKHICQKSFQVEKQLH